jgi:hypothetical protein
MTDTRDDAGNASAVKIETEGKAPQLDGSVDALVANLRAAKEQLAQLLESAGKNTGESDDDADKPGRSAA